MSRREVQMVAPIGRMITNTREIANGGLVFTQWTPLAKGGIDLGQASREGYVQGIASAQWKDHQKEVMHQAGIDWTYFDGEGVLNDNHDPSAAMQLGEPVRRWSTMWTPPGRDIAVPATGMEVLLYLHKPRALESWQTIKAQFQDPRITRRMGLSLEGFATMRDPADRNQILRSVATNVALTPNPVFPGARLESLAKSMGGVGYQSPAGLSDETYSGLVKQDLGAPPDGVADTVAGMARSKKLRRYTVSQVADLIRTYHPNLNKAQALGCARVAFDRAKQLEIAR